MIGDNLSHTAHQKLKLWGTVVILGFYIFCIVQAKEWMAYSVVCGPLTMVTWVWGLGAYKRPRETGRIANFGTPGGLSLGRVTEIAGQPPQEPILRPDPHPGGLTPGGRSIQFDATKTLKLSKPKTPNTVPVVRVSRHKRVSDRALWVV